MGIVELIVFVFATWRLTTMVMEEDGPFDIFDHLRGWLNVDVGESLRFFDRLFTCHWCMSIWCGAIVYLAPFPLAVILALSAFSIMFHILVERRHLVV